MDTKKEIEKWWSKEAQKYLNESNEIFNENYHKKININLLYRLWRKKQFPGVFKSVYGILLKVIIANGIEIITVVHQPWMEKYGIKKSWGSWDKRRGVVWM